MGISLLQWEMSAVYNYKMLDAVNYGTCMFIWQQTEFYVDSVPL